MKIIAWSRKLQLREAQAQLWHPTGHRRLTVLLDPARIKRGLASHRQVGYPLRSGEPFRLVVDDGFRDARGDTVPAALTLRLLTELKDQ